VRGAAVRAMLGLTILCAVGAALAPWGFAAMVVAVFAGPHNWIECRYALTRIPLRAGRLGRFLRLSAAGIIFLTAGVILLAWASRSWSPAALRIAHSAWLSSVVLWVTLLIEMRRNQPSRRDLPDPWPAALAMLSLCWTLPQWVAVSLIYLHPLIAFWILDREIGRRPGLDLRSYRWILTTLPIFVSVLCWYLSAGSLVPDGELTARIAHHAGAALLPGVPAVVFVGTHAFLEALHYCVWLVVIPAVVFRTGARIPLARHAGGGAGVRLVLSAGGLLVVLVWLGFHFNPVLTWEIYFLLATWHVLAEAPLLLQLL
jgi:hypothetical protein